MTELRPYTLPQHPSAREAIKSPTSIASQPSTTHSTRPTPAPRIRRQKKAVLTLSDRAIARLRAIKSSDNKLIKISVVAKGCAGGAYKLEYVTQAQKFDESVTQDGITVLIDSKSLLKIIGSEMDFVDDVLSSRFTFNNPNVTGTCGCEESFTTD